MENLLYEVKKALQNSVDQCDSNLLGLSGGLDSSIIASLMKNKLPQALAIITKDFISTDLTYCQLVAKKFELPLEINTIETEDLLTAIEKTIKILKNFNDIEIRNSVVGYLLLKKTKVLGNDSIITGDGADELFLGYNFLLEKSLFELESERVRLKEIMHFPIMEIGKSLNIKINSPFLNEVVLEIAEKIPTNLLVKSENNKTYGKWILRKAFESEIPPVIAWRKKTAMQDGSGTSGLTHFFDSLIPDRIFEKKKKEIKDSQNIIIRTKESMHYFELYCKYVGMPKSDNSVQQKCPYCQFSLKSKRRFCSMCGAFPI